MASREQVNRLLALVPYLLQSRGRADLAATAAVFGVSPAQLVDDLKVLWYCGLPGGLPGDLIEVDVDGLDTGTIRLGNADYLARPLRFTPDEALSLLVAVSAVRALAGDDLSAAVDSAREKLSRAAGSAAPAGVAVSVSSGTAQVRQQLIDAIAARAVVRLTYDGLARGRTTRPQVEPGRLSVRDGYAYLDAWSLERDAWRTFRLDRIAAVEATGQPAGERGDVPVFDGGWLDARPEAAQVTLVVAEPARWIAEYVPVVSSRSVPGGLEVVLKVADPAWLRALLLRLGPGVLAVDPPEAAASAREAAVEALQRYE
jgi:proteasome accessory factor C